MSDRLAVDDVVELFTQAEQICRDGANERIVAPEGALPPLGVFASRTGPSLEEQLLDAQMHVGRLENELALAKAGIADSLRWSTMPPAMSGDYLNAEEDEFEPGKPIEPSAHWRVVHFEVGGPSFIPVDRPLGPYWAGPLTIGGPG